MLQPYVCLHRVSPTTNSPSSQLDIDVKWFVGGADRVHATWVSISEYHNINNSDGNSSKPSIGINASAIFSGKGFNREIFKTGNGPCSSHTNDQTKSCFESTIKVRASQTAAYMEVFDGSWKILEPADNYSVVVWALVDEHWGVPGQGFPIHLSPQSYYVRARTDVGLRVRNGLMNRELSGRLMWQAIPFSVVLHRDRGTLSVGDDVTLQCAWWQLTSASKSTSSPAGTRAQAVAALPSGPSPEKKLQTGAVSLEAFFEVACICIALLVLFHFRALHKRKHAV